MKNYSLRQLVARFIEKQMNFESKASSEKTNHHYGWQELRELMDYIYHEKPTCKDQKLSRIQEE